MSEKQKVCPRCGSDQVTATEEHMIMLNTLEHYCHSVKAWDEDAKASCLSCEWRGRVSELSTANSADD